MLKCIVDFDYNYLTEDHLKGFDKYKYSAVDTNPLSIYLMHPFWNLIVHACPRWIAPNLLTFVGFVMTAFGCFLFSIYDYHFYAGTGYEGTEPIPPWVFMSVSVLIFVAYTLDGIDGKQARRMGMSGPLGELFDHGLDSWTAVLIPVCLFSVFGRADFGVPPVRFYGICWNVFLTFYTTHCEKYITGILFLPWGYDLSMLATTGVIGASYFIGHDGWKITVAGTISTGRIVEIIFYASSLLATLPVSVYNIRRSYKEKKAKQNTFAGAIRPLIALAGLLIITVGWVFLSPTDLVSSHPRAYMLMTGTIFSNITCRLVVAQMSDTKCSAWNSLISLAGVSCAVSMLMPQLEVLSLYALWVISTYTHIHYGTCVVRQMCEHFRIRCFKVGKIED